MDLILYVYALWFYFSFKFLQIGSSSFRLAFKYKHLYIQVYTLQTKFSFFQSVFWLTFIYVYTILSIFFLLKAYTYMVHR